MAALHFDADYREEAVLRDGRKARLRLLRPDDKPLLVEGLANLSEASRYLRFFSTRSTLSQGELRYLTEMDQMRHFALGALEEDEGGKRRGLGVARFIELEEEPGTAEPAIVVADDCQGQGLGRLLFLRLVAAAAERGVKRFRSEVLTDNRAMRHLLQEMFPDSEETIEGSVVHVRFDLPNVATREPTGSERARGRGYGLLKAAARGEED